jgi:hypothetical protein
VAGGIADHEDAVVGRRAQLVRDPVALVAVELDAQVARELDGRVLDSDPRVEGADADADLVARGEQP